MTQTEFNASVNAAIRRDVAIGEREALAEIARDEAIARASRGSVHLNIASRYASVHPEWEDDCIPACDCDGDGPLDFYAADPAFVTCPGCLAVAA